MAPPIDNDLQVGLLAVRSAARAARAVQRTLSQSGTLHKDDQSPVTVADYAVQALVARALAEGLPGDPIVGEEDATALRQPGQERLCEQVVAAVAAAVGRRVDRGSLLDWIDRGGAAGDTDRYWVLDPIDGTKGFLRGGQYAIALGLIERGQVVAGILGCPSYESPGMAAPGLLLFARAGGGAFELPLDAAPTTAPARLSVAGPRPLAEYRFCESVESGHSDQQRSAAIASALGIRGAPLRMDSQAKYAAIARGDAEIYMRLPTRADYREKVWDHAAGMLVVTAAGGTVTDVDGKALDFASGRQLQHNRGVLASNGPVHGALLAAVAAALTAR